MSLNDNDMSFLPDGYLEDRTQRRANILWGGLFAVVAIAIGVAYYYAERNVRTEEGLNKMVQTQFEASKKNLEKLQDLQKVQQELNRKVKLSGSLVEKVLRTEILAELTNLLPENVVLLQVQLENKKITAPAKNMTAIERALAAHEAAKASLPDPIQYDVPIRVQGIATDDMLVAQYMAKLSQSRFFGNLRLPETAEFVPVMPEGQKDKAPKLRKFELEMMLKRTADTRLATAATQPVAAAK